MDNNKLKCDKKISLKGEIGEVSQMQLLLKKEVEEAPLMEDGQSLQITFNASERSELSISGNNSTSTALAID